MALRSMARMLLQSSYRYTMLSSEDDVVVIGTVPHPENSEQQARRGKLWSRDRSASA
jgi:hypothetical protein